MKKLILLLALMLAMPANAQILSGIVSGTVAGAVGGMVAGSIVDKDGNTVEINEQDGVVFCQGEIQIVGETFDQCYFRIYDDVKVHMHKEDPPMWGEIRADWIVNRVNKLCDGSKTQVVCKTAVQQ